MFVLSRFLDAFCYYYVCLPFTVRRDGFTEEVSNPDKKYLFILSELCHSIEAAFTFILRLNAYTNPKFILRSDP